MPRLYDHCETIYYAMKAHSYEEGNDRIYRGAVTKVFNESNISVSWYGNVMDMLKRMGCVSQTSRGAGGQPSIWTLHNDPTEESWKAVDKGTKSLKREEQERLLATILERLLRLEDTQRDILLTLKDKGVLIVRHRES